MSNDETSDFAAFMKEREKAAKAYVCGESGPLSELATEGDPATFFAPRGGHVAGAKEVSATYERDAGHFEKESETHFEVLHQGASDGLGYWVGYQHARANLRGKDGPVPMRLRITELYRRENGRWKLIHRHADAAADEKKGGLFRELAAGLRVAFEAR